MPRTTSLCRTIRPGRIPFRGVDACRTSSEFCASTISHAPDRDGLDLILSVGTQGGDIPEQEAKTDINGDYDFRNRVYSLTLGRWLTNDLLGVDAGDLNTFRYLGNGVDPLGLQQPPVKPVPPLTGPPPFPEKPVPGRSGFVIDISNPSLPWYFQFQNDKFKFGSQTGGNLPIGIPGLSAKWNLKTGTTGDFWNGTIYPGVDFNLSIPVVKRSFFLDIGINLYHIPYTINTWKQLPGQERFSASFKLN